MKRFIKWLLFFFAIIAIAFVADTILALATMFITGMTDGALFYSVLLLLTTVVFAAIMAIFGDDL